MEKSRLSRKRRPTASSPRRQPKSTGANSLATAPIRQPILTAPDVLYLQRTIGNRATQALLKPQQTPVTTPAADTPDVQPLLMSFDTFRKRKKAAVTRKYWLTHRATKDVKKIYAAYYTARRQGKLGEAHIALDALQMKIIKMRGKDYWNDVKLAYQLLDDLQKGLDEEREVLKTLPDNTSSVGTSGSTSANKASKEEVEEKEKEKGGEKGKEKEEKGSSSSGASTSINAGAVYEIVADTFRGMRQKIDLPIGHLDRPELEPILRNQQRARIIAEAITRATSIAPDLNGVITKERFIDSLCETMLSRGQFILVDVMNEIASQFSKYMNQIRLADAVDSIAHSTLSPAEKLVEIAQLLWGGFSWETEKPNDFRLWVEMDGDNKFEPSSTGTMNCWEGVLFIMIKAGILDKTHVVSAYHQKSKSARSYYAALMMLLGYNNTDFWKLDGEVTGKHPQAGDIIFFEWSRNDYVQGDSMQHVALSLGVNGDGEDEIMSLWWGETGSILGKTTIQALNKGSYEYISFTRAPVMQ